MERVTLYLVTDPSARLSMATFYARIEGLLMARCETTLAIIGYVMIRGLLTNRITMSRRLMRPLLMLLRQQNLGGYDPGT